MEIGDKVCCKKDILRRSNFNQFKFEKGENYIISDIDTDFGFVIIKGFGFYLSDGDVFFFEEYFYNIKEMRKLKIQNIKDMLKYEK